MNFTETNNFVKTINRAISYLVIGAICTKPMLDNIYKINTELKKLNTDNVIDEILSNGSNILEYIHFYEMKCENLLKSTFEYDPGYCYFRYIDESGEVIERALSDLVFITEYDTPDTELDLTDEEYYEALILIRSIAFGVWILIGELKQKLSQIKTITADHIPQIEETNRTMTTEALKKYFKPQFKGFGNNINTYETFMLHLQQNRTAKEFAKIALLAYEGSMMNDQKPSTFSEWLSIFYNAVGITCNHKYKKSELKNIDDSMKNLFCYLY